MQKITFLFAWVLLAVTSKAQDPHFSQYYASPMTVNPAMTGMFTGDMRASGLYRQQWAQYGAPFISGTLALEFKPRVFQDGANINRLAFGGMVLYDQTPGGVLKGQNAYATIAYHQALDAEGHSRLGLGVMGGYNQRMLDPTGLTFASQFQSGGFNTGAPGEAIPSYRSSSFDLHAGLLYSYETEDRLFYGGGSVYHILEPRDYFLGNNEVLTTTPRRLNLNAGMNIKGASLNYAASLLVMRQQGANQALVGGAVGVPFGENGVLYGGAWYRVGESIIPTINLQWSTFNLGVSYDTFTNGGKTTVQPNSFELSLSYRLVRYHDYRSGCFAF